MAKYTSFDDPKYEGMSMDQMFKQRIIDNSLEHHEGESSRLITPLSEEYKNRREIWKQTNKRTFGEHLGNAFPMSGLLGLPVFVFLFFLILTFPAIQHFLTYPERFIVDDGTNVSYGIEVSDYNELSDYARYVGIDVVSDPDLSSEDAFYIWYHGKTWTQYAGDNGVTVLTLTNLIQNGRFVDNTTWAASGGSFTVSNGEALFTASAQFQRVYKLITISASTNYYLNAKVKTTSNLVGLRFIGISVFAVYHSGSGNYETLTGVINSTTFSGSHEAFSVVDTRSSGWNQIIFDDAILFASGSYTKTQLDSAIAFYGYPTYNVTYNWPDVTDTDYQTAYDNYYNGLYETYLEYYDAVDLDGFDVPDPTHDLFYAYGLDDVTKLYLDEGIFNFTNYYWVNTEHYTIVGNQVMDGLDEVIGEGSILQILMETVKYMSVSLLTNEDLEESGYPTYTDLNTDGELSFWEKLVYALRDFSLSDIIGH